MTMDTFKKLVIASGQNLVAAGVGLDSTCKATAFSKNVTMDQFVLTKPDGTPISAHSQVIVDQGVCKLTNVSLTGC
jgi:signal recognition particle GTPase